MAIPINLLSEHCVSYKSKVSYHSLRNPISIPNKYTLYLTRKCNLFCGMCTQNIVRSNSHSITDMSIDVWKKLIKETHWTYPIYTLFGGEPLMYGNIREIIKEISLYHCSYEIVTNGYFLEDFVNDIVTSDSKLIISMSGTEQVHNTIKGSRHSYSKIHNALMSIAKNNPEYLNRISINIVLLPENIKDIPDLITELYQLGIHRFSLQHPQWFDPTSTSKSVELLYEDCNAPFDICDEMRKSYDFNSQYRDSIEELKENIKRNFSDCQISFLPDFNEIEILLYYENYLHPEIKKDCVCLMPWMNPTIEPDGTIRSCIGNSLGNIQDFSFWEIWNGDQNNKFRRNLMLHGKFPVCTRCCMYYEKII